MGVDGLFVGFCLHLASHYQILRDRISALKGDGNEPKIYSQHQNNKKLEDEIVSIIDRHVELIRLTQTVSKIFSMVVFVHFFASAIVIGMTSINFLLVSLIRIVYLEIIPNYLACPPS